MQLRTLAFISTLALVASSQAATITQWLFNGGTGTTTPSTGTGTIGTVGGTSSSFASGTASGGSSDLTTVENFGLGITTFPAASTGNETAGIQAAVSTVGYNNISLSFDQRFSSTSSRYVAVYYTLDGATYTKFNLAAGNSNSGITPTGGNPAGVAGGYGAASTFATGVDPAATGSGDDWYNGRTVDFSAIAGANNNANFAVRVVSSFDGGTNYSTTAGGTYATTGTWRFDAFTLSGTAVPEPTTLAGIALIGGLALARRRQA